MRGTAATRSGWRAPTPSTPVWRNRDTFLTGRAAIRGVLDPEMGARAGLRAAQEPVGLPREPDRGPFPVRVPRRRRPVVAQLRQRTVGSSTPHGPMARREASINDVRISESDRRIFGPRPEGERGAQIPLHFESHTKATRLRTPGPGRNGEGTRMAIRTALGVAPLSSPVSCARAAAPLRKSAVAPAGWSLVTFGDRRGRTSATWRVGELLAGPGRW